MAVEITMPQLSDTMSEGRILRWLKNKGDNVRRGEALAEVATDKADLRDRVFSSGVSPENSSAGWNFRQGRNGYRLSW